MTIFGFFSSPDDATPTYDPGLLVRCPFCLMPLDYPRRKAVTTSICGDSGRSYFYRAHKECQEGASNEVVGQIEVAALRGY